MSAPVILTTQSVLECVQWQPFGFQPQATNDPTAWFTTDLPPGATFDPVSGLITGPFTQPGVYNFFLRAQNSDGFSDPIPFVIGIEASSFTAPGATIDLAVDLGTGAVTNSSGGPATITALPNGDQPLLPPLLWIKEGDTRAINIRFTKGGNTIDLDFATLAINVKWMDTENNRVITTTLFDRMATGSDTFYQVILPATGSLLKATLSNGEDPSGTALVLLAEITGTASIAAPDDAPDGWPTTYRLTGLNFGLGIYRELHG